MLSFSGGIMKYTQGNGLVNIVKAATAVGLSATLAGCSWIPFMARNPDANRCQVTSIYRNGVETVQRKVCDSDGNGNPDTITYRLEYYGIDNDPRRGPFYSDSFYTIHVDDSTGRVSRADGDRIWRNSYDAACTFETYRKGMRVFRPECKSLLLLPSDTQAQSYANKAIAEFRAHSKSR